MPVVIKRQVSSPVEHTILWRNGQTTVLGGGQTLQEYAADDRNPGDKVHPTPFYWRKADITPALGNGTRSDPKSGYASWSGGVGVFGNSSAFWNSSDKNIAYNNAMDKLVSKVRGDVDLMIDILSYKELAGTVKRLVKCNETFAELMWSLRGNKKERARALSGLWLEWTYGVSPIVSTIKEIAGRMAKEAENRPFVRVKARGQFSDSRVDKHRFSTFTVYSAQVPFTDHVSHWCQITVNLKADMTRLQELLTYISLNPIGWLYEKTPYSFVVDWFWDFGSYMRQVETSLAWARNFESGSVTFSSRRRCEIIPVSGMDSGNNPFSITGGASEQTFFQRTKLSSFPTARLPVLHPDVGVRRAMNAFALMVQAGVPPEERTPRKDPKHWTRKRVR